MEFGHFTNSYQPQEWKTRTEGPGSHHAEIFAALAAMPATGMRRLCVAVVVCLGVALVHRGLLTFCPGQSPAGAG